MFTRSETELIDGAGGARSEPGGRAQRSAGGEPFEIADAIRDRLSDEVIDELLAGARIEEEIVGPGGVLARLMKRLVERAVSAELSEHLGYEPYQERPGGVGDTRNGSTPKAFATERGPVDVRTPRERKGTFEPQIVRKGRRRFRGVRRDDRRALLARLVDARDRGAAGRDLRGQGRPRLISGVTEAVMEDVREWQQRPLDDVYPVVFLDALVLKIREGGSVQRPACCLALAVTVEGERDVLGIWFLESEGAKLWMQILSELKQRGVDEIPDLLRRRVEGASRRRSKRSPDHARAGLHRRSDPAQPQVRAAAGARAGRPRPEADLHRRRRRGQGCVRGSRREMGSAFCR